MMLIILAARWYLPFSLFKLWGLPVFLASNGSLGFSYFLYQKKASEMVGFWVNWLVAVVFVVSCGFAMLPWLCFMYLPYEWLILCTLFMALTPVLAILTLIGSQKVWLAAVLPVMLSLILYTLTGWQASQAMGQWLAIWLFVFTLLMFFLQKRNNQLLHRTLVDELE